MRDYAAWNDRFDRPIRKPSTVVVTGTGRRALEVAAPAHVEAVRQWFFDGLTPAQVRLVDELAAGVLDRLS